MQIKYAYLNILFVNSSGQARAIHDKFTCISSTFNQSRGEWGVSKHVDYNIYFRFSCWSLLWLANIYCDFIQERLFFFLKNWTRTSRYQDLCSYGLRQLVVLTTSLLQVVNKLVAIWLSKFVNIQTYLQVVSTSCNKSANLLPGSPKKALLFDFI